jgi:hypothetical protein
VLLAPADVLHVPVPIPVAPQTVILHVALDITHLMAPAAGKFASTAQPAIPAPVPVMHLL